MPRFIWCLHHGAWHLDPGTILIFKTYSVNWFIIILL
jgi:hypothetical protein